MIGPTRKIVIIGGGLSGLSAAFYIRKFYKEAGIKPDIVLLEKEKNLGGKIETLHRDGFVIEKGPDSFLAERAEMCELAKELELDHELVSSNPLAKKRYILQRDKQSSANRSCTRYPYRTETFFIKWVSFVWGQNTCDDGFYSSSAA